MMVSCLVRWLSTDCLESLDSFHLYIRVFIVVRIAITSYFCLPLFLLHHGALDVTDTYNLIFFLILWEMFI